MSHPLLSRVPFSFSRRLTPFLSSSIPSFVSASSYSVQRRESHFPSHLMKPPRHLLTTNDLTRREIYHILSLAADIREHPHSYLQSLPQYSLLMLFQKPSLRTRLSFEVGMTQLGGHAIYYPLDSMAPLGKKESISDTSKVVSRYVNIIMARLNSRKEVRELAKYASVPVINALDDYGHPCQILADLLTIQGALHITSLSGLKLAYVGDIANNVTYDLCRASCLLGMHIKVAGPINKGKQFQMEESVLAECKSISASHTSDHSGTGSPSPSGTSHGTGTVTVCESAEEAVSGAEVVLTDSWHSYHISSDPNRDTIFAPYRVTSRLMSLAHKNAIFMHCLPATRGQEVEAEVIDGKASVVFDEAENRLHAQKALMLFLLGKDH